MGREGKSYWRTQQRQQERFGWRFLLEVGCEPVVNLSPWPLKPFCLYGSTVGPNHPIPLAKASESDLLYSHLAGGRVLMSSRASAVRHPLPFLVRRGCHLSAQTLHALKELSHSNG